MELKDKILAAQDLDAELLEVPEWDVTIEVRSPTAGDRARLLTQFVNPESGVVENDKMQAAVAVMCCFDPESGERLFDEEDIPALMEKAAKPVERIFRAGNRLSGLTEDIVDEGKDS